MTKITVTNAFSFEVKERHSGLKDLEITYGDEKAKLGQEHHTEISDGYHTMDELYDHRITIYIALCCSLAGMAAICDEYGKDKSLAPEVWRSKTHSDGSVMEGWFVLGIQKKKGEQITYHLPLERWSETDFAETLEKAPEWDGHTSEDVIKRLKFMYA